MGIDQILYVIAILFFILAAAPINKNGWGLEWVAFAVLVLTLVV